MALEFTVYGEAAPRGSKVGGTSKTGKRYYRDSSKKSYPWMSDVAKAAALAMNGYDLFTGPLKVEFDFYRPRPAAHYGSGKNADKVKASAPRWPTVSPDVGKLARGTLDAMEGIVFRNDAQVVWTNERKHYGTPARCDVKITPLPTS